MDRLGPHTLPPDFIADEAASPPLKINQYGSLVMFERAINKDFYYHSKLPSFGEKGSLCQFPSLWEGTKGGITPSSILLLRGRKGNFQGGSFSKLGNNDKYFSYLSRSLIILEQTPFFQFSSLWEEASSQFLLPLGGDKGEVFPRKKITLMLNIIGGCYES